MAVPVADQTAGEPGAGRKQQEPRRHDEAMHTSTAETAKLYREWAQVEAHGSSPIYERLALAVAEDSAALEFLSKVEPAKRQPNLLFGALRWHNVTVEDPAEALAWLREHQDAVLAVVRTRRTQTNEVARCATLLPALALLPQPLALIEVGASGWGSSASAGRSVAQRATSLVCVRRVRTTARTASWCSRSQASASAGSSTVTLCQRKAPKSKFGWRLAGSTFDKNSRAAESSATARASRS